MVKLQQILKKWKNIAVGTQSFSDNAAAVVPKGYLALSVGEEMRRFVIPTEYLHHRAFAALLEKAEEEFGFGQEGVLRIPGEVAAFESVLRAVEEKKKKKKIDIHNKN
ncbi:auxin-induced protein 15A-like [Zingiber officinale]|uniref:Uncharacterized protein n=1 Tax=Zingiber officinale TaxID=94328 RepID=A0A8J5H827_ZINOF|nr:auxin-induced protein 15A-like [Zingiber officinale]KAG6522789.1 hypothetical protein ZIOFF_019944 [Zingiber officinale]